MKEESGETPKKKKRGGKVCVRTTGSAMMIDVVGEAMEGKAKKGMRRECLYLCVFGFRTCDVDRQKERRK